MLFWVFLPIIILLVVTALTLWGLATLNEHQQTEPWERSRVVHCDCGTFSFANEQIADEWMRHHTCKYDWADDLNASNPWNT